eukprot:95074-Rhodomonas_salina.1
MFYTRNVHGSGYPREVLTWSSKATTRNWLRASYQCNCLKCQSFPNLETERPSLLVESDADWTATADRSSHGQVRAEA